MGSDILIHNGMVWTGDPEQPRATAIGISGNRIVGVGSEETVRGLLSRDAIAIDASGRTVLPGLIDAHNHYLATAEALASVNVRYPVVASRADLTRVIGEVAEVTPPGRWIRAVGLDWSKFPDGQPPTRRDLDEATLAHPVIVYHVSVHHALVNTPAMRERGITDAVQDPPGGQFVRDEAGRLTGLCLDAATDMILPVVVDIGCHGPNFHTLLPGEDSVALLAAASPVYLAAGLTTVCDPQVTRREMRVYQAAAARGLLGLRAALMPLSNHLDDFNAIGLTPPFGDDRLRIVAMKLYADGTLIGGTAWFSEPYGPHGEFTGSTYWPPEQLTELVGSAHRHGWQVGIHTQGDRAMAMSLDAIEAAMRATPRRETRHRIEHCGFPTPAQVRRMASLGVIPVNQPNFLVDSGDDFIRHLGNRAHRLQPMREEIEAGLRPVLSSDAFVSSLRPLDTISAALSRRTRSGVEIGADHRLTLDEALRAHTIDAATAIGLEDRIGSLQVGKLADVAIVDGNLETTEPERLGSLGMWMTLLDGEIVWQAETVPAGLSQDEPWPGREPSRSRACAEAGKRKRGSGLQIIDSRPGLAIVPPGSEREALLPLLLLADEAEPLRGYLHEGDLYALTDENRAVIGVTHVLPVPTEPGTMELKAVAVDQNRHNRGVGKRMLAGVLADLRARGARRVIVGTSNAGIGQIAFYQKVGFRLWRIERDYFTPEKGYDPDVRENGLPHIDMVWFDMEM